mmetsp:Transcript_98716/g.268071  ORF Transcript_98716/g.268071 Transcript_98716/m.268071 type:complete len:206 (+) Transcript_98716:280-897(+)
MFRRKKADQSDVREGRGGFDGLWIRLPEAGQVRLDARPEPLGAPPEPDGEAGHDRELPLGVHRPQRHVVPLALLPHEWGHPGPVREHGEHAADHGEVGEGRPVPARLLGLPRHDAGRLQARARRPERPWHELQGGPLTLRGLVHRVVAADPLARREQRLGDGGDLAHHLQQGGHRCEPCVGRPQRKPLQALGHQHHAAWLRRPDR